MQDIFFDIGVIIIIATIGGLLSRMLKQPLIPAYILAGLVVGPIFSIVSNYDIITILSEIGIAFLLFIVGMEIDLKKLKNVAMISTAGALLQFFILFSVGFFVATFFGLGMVEALYIALIIAFSSTMVVVKLLSDKKQLDTMHGRMIIGILLMQDILAVFALAILTTMEQFSMLILLVALFKGVIFIALSIVLLHFVLPPLFKFAAKSQELLFLSSVSVCFLFSILALNIGNILLWLFSLPVFNISPDKLVILQPGFSIIVGAFIAGVGLANLPYNIEIIGKVKSLKDFFATIFFVSLGTKLYFTSINGSMWLLIALVILVILIKPLVIMFSCGFFGYTKRPSFLTSISLAQISEFSLIIVIQGLALGHVGNNVYVTTIVLAMITIVLTSYIIKYDSNIYNGMSKYLGVFEKMSVAGEVLEYIPKKVKTQVIAVGYDRIGFSIVRTLKSMKKKILVIDFNPEIIKKLIKNKVPCLYGDIGDIEIIDRLNLKEVEMVVSTVPNYEENHLLVKKLREVNKKAPVLVTANEIEEALKLYDYGADYVILPHFLGGEHVSLLMEDFSRDINKMLETKLKHVKELKHRHRLGHVHPRNIHRKRK